LYFVHPVRITHWRALTLAALVAWALLAVLAVAKDLAPGFWTVTGLCVLALYFVGVGLLRRRDTSRAE
jgi:uncharacterized membrane protein